METYPLNQQAVSINGGIEDILFENRNTEYGAYNLRKEYNNRLLFGLLITVSTLCAVITFPILLNILFLGAKERVIDYNPTPIPPDVINFPITLPPPPPPPVTDQQLNKSVTYRGFEVVDEVPKTTNMLNQIPMDPIPTDNEPADKNSFIPVGPGPIFDSNTIDSTYISVQESARFNNGSINDFSNWVKSKLSIPQYISENGGLSGYEVVQFVINKDGEISNVVFRRSVHRVIDEQLTKLFKQSPKWAPARQNGFVVKQQFTLPIKFVLN